MKNLKKYHLTALLFFVGFHLFAQNAKEDLRKVSEAYSHFENLSMSIDYRVYDNYVSIAPIDLQYGEYKKRGDEYYNKLMGFETLVTKEKMLTVDTSSKQIIIKPAKKLSNMDISGVDMGNVLKMYKKIEFVNEDKYVKGYKIYFKDSAVSPLFKIEVYYNESNFLIQKMVLFYRIAINLSDEKTTKEEKPRLEINFSDIRTNPSFSKDEFSMSKYIKSGSTPTVRYKNYQITELKN